MAGKPAEQPPSGERSQTDRRADARTEGRESEGRHQLGDGRVGPLAMSRYEKDDGRALILYVDDRPPRDGGRGT
jgi:hypothetical protein